MAKSNIQDIARFVARKHGLSQKDAEEFVGKLFDVVGDGLRNDKLVKIKGLGTFKVIDVKDRESVDVNTGERILIEGREKITFTPDNVMKELVNKPFSQFETVVLNEGVDFSDMDAVGETVESKNIHSVDGKTEDAALSPEVPDDPQGEGCEERKEPAVDHPLVQEDGERMEEAVAEETEVPENLQPVDSPVEESAEKNAAELDEPVTEQEKSVLEQEEEVKCLEEKETEERNTNKTEIDTVMNERDSNPWRRVFPFFWVALIAGGIGFYVGRKTAPTVVIPVAPSVVMEGVVGDSILADSSRITDSIENAYNAKIKSKVDSVTRVNEHRNESIRIAREKRSTGVLPVAPAVSVEKKAKGAESAAAASKMASKPKNPVQKPAPQPSAAAPKTENSKAMSTARNIARTGAYTIVGTQKTITVKQGQSMKSIAKVYLGDGMECYIQVHNGVSEVSEGMKVNIPQLQLKKK